jgi:small-conductance mechanosensitive channel
MFGFLTILFCIIYVDSNIIKESKYMEGFFYAIIFYIWFWLTTKTHLYTTIIILLLLLIVYILQIHINIRYQKLEKKQKELDQEQIELDQEQIELEQNIDNIKLSQHIIIGSALVITIIGSIYYYFAKKKEYGEDFDTLTFIFGNNKCNNNKDGTIENTETVENKD